MAYIFERGGSYRMPTHFGQVSGARNLPAHVKPDHTKFPETTRFSIHFLSDAAQLEEQLPPGFELAGDPIVTLYFSTMKGIQWLAGRGYNVLSYSFPATFRGRQDTITGHFKAALWEALPDACISGREDLGFPKLWADIPDPRVMGNVHHYEASWLGFKFIQAEFRAEDAVATLPAVRGQAKAVGTLNYKYIPKTGHRGEADVACVTYWPQFESQNVEKILIGKGSFRMPEASWEDLPTMHHVVNRIGKLPVREILSSTLVFGRGQGDVANMQILA